MEKTRCYICEKRLNIAQEFKCKCGLFFCNNHRPSYSHKCAYDYKKEHRDKLTKDNPKISSKKIENI